MTCHGISCQLNRFSAPPPPLCSTQEFTGQLISFIWEPLIAALKKEPEPELTAVMLDSLAEIVDLAEAAHLSGQQVEAAFGAFSAILSAAEARRSQRSKVRRWV